MDKLTTKYIICMQTAILSALQVILVTSSVTVPVKIIAAVVVTLTTIINMYIITEV